MVTLVIAAAAFAGVAVCVLLALGPPPPRLVPARIARPIDRQEPLR